MHTFRLAKQNHIALLFKNRVDSEVREILLKWGLTSLCFLQEQRTKLPVYVDQELQRSDAAGVSILVCI